MSNLSNQEIANILIIFDKRISEVEQKVCDVQNSFDEYFKNLMTADSSNKMSRNSHRTVEFTVTNKNSNKNAPNSPSPKGHKYTKQALLKIKEHVKIPKLDPLQIKSKIQRITDTQAAQKDTSKSCKTDSSRNQALSVLESPRGLNELMQQLHSLQSISECSSSLKRNETHETKEMKSPFESKTNKKQEDKVILNDTNQIPKVYGGLLVEDFED